MVISRAEMMQSYSSKQCEAHNASIEGIQLKDSFFLNIFQVEGRKSDY